MPIIFLRTSHSLIMFNQFSNSHWLQIKTFAPSLMPFIHFNEFLRCEHLSPLISPPHTVNLFGSKQQMPFSIQLDLIWWREQGKKAPYSQYLGTHRICCFRSLYIVYRQPTLNVFHYTVSNFHFL